MKFPAHAIIILSTAFCFLGCQSSRFHREHESTKKAVLEAVESSIEVGTPSGDIELSVNEQIQDLLQEPLTESDVVRITLINNPAIRALYEELGIQRGNLVQAGIIHNPHFHLEFADSFEVPRISRPDTRDFQFHASVAMDIVDVLLMPQRKRISKVELERTKLWVQKEILEFVRKAKEGVISYQAERMKRDAVQQRLDGAHAALDLAQKQHNAGNINDLELANRLRDFQRAKFVLRDQEKRVRMEQMRLNQLMGLWGEQTDWKITKRLDTPEFESLEWENIESRVLANSLTLQGTVFALEILDEQIRLRRMSVVPSAELGIAREQEDDHPPTTWGSVGFEVPIFDRKQGNISALASQAEKMRYSASEDAIRIRTLSRMLVDTYNDLHRKEEYYRESVLPTEQRIVDLSEEHYNGMFIGVFDLLRAKQEQLDTQVEYIEVLKNCWFARTDLDHVLAGGELPEPMSDSIGTQPDGNSEQTGHH